MILHLLIGKLHAVAADGVGLGTGGNLGNAEIDEIGTERFFFERLPEKDIEHQAAFGLILLYENPIYQVVMLLKEPWVVCFIKMA